MRARRSIRRFIVRVTMRRINLASGERSIQSIDYCPPTSTINNAPDESRVLHTYIYAAIGMRGSSEICKFVNRKVLHAIARDMTHNVHILADNYNSSHFAESSAAQVRVDCTLASLFSSREACSLRGRLARRIPAFARLCKYTL